MDRLIDNEPIHTWFELSYCSYLVLPRSILQAMPVEWQQRLVDLLEEAEEMLDTSKIPGRYTVQLRDSKGRFTKDKYCNYRRPIEIPFKKI